MPEVAPLGMVAEFREVLAASSVGGIVLHALSARGCGWQDLRCSCLRRAAAGTGAEQAARRLLKLLVLLIGPTIPACIVHYLACVLRDNAKAARTYGLLSHSV